MSSNQCYLSLGSNLGNRKSTIQNAYRHIRKFASIDKYSRFYENEAVGFESATLFLNTVICIRTELSPLHLLNRIQEIEKQLGRHREPNQKNYTSRTIDIDIIDYQGQIIAKKNLQIPHPKLKERFFVLEPLQEINPDWIDPRTKCSIKELISTLKKESSKIILTP